MTRFFQLLWAFLLGLLGLSRTKSGKRRKKRATPRPVTRPPAERRPARPAERRTRRRASPERLAERLADVLPAFERPGPWDPREAVRLEDGLVAIDLHGLTDEAAVEVVEAALAEVEGSAALRLITGHGRERSAGYSLIRVALVDALDGREGVAIVDAERHRRHARSDDRLGHMDIVVD